MDPWHYDPASDLEQSLAARLKQFPREPDMLVYGLRGLAAVAVRGWLRVYHRFCVRGRQWLPANGSYILVANHSSHLDAVCLLAALPFAKLHRAFPAAARDYFFVTTHRAFAAAVLVNALPFEREASPRQSLAICRRLLDNPGNVLVLFPEGTRSPNGRMGEFKAGIGMLVCASDVPVLPCYISGASAALPKGTWLPRPRKVTVTIGQPLTFAHRPRGKESALQIAEELRTAVLALASQESLS
ncbi:MAG: lysophospholipid acyltransferase family protein [Gemmataceae bacterium]